MAFRNYLEGEDDKPYFHLNSLAHYYEEMQRYAALIKEMTGYIKDYGNELGLTKEEIDQRVTAYILQNKAQLDQRLGEWDEKLQQFDGSVTDLLAEWVDDGTLNHIIDMTLLSKKADIVEVDKKIGQLVSGSPKGVYTTLIDLETAHPSGDTGIYIVRENNSWYWWNGINWLVGGLYETTSYGKEELYTLLDFPNPVPETAAVTLTNILTANSNAWTAISGTVTLLNDTVTLNATGTGAQITKSISLTPDRKYWLKGTISSSHNKAYLYVSGAVGVYHSGSGEYETLSTVLSAVTASTTLRIRDYSTENWQPITAKNLMLIDLTTVFGAGKEPNNTELLSLIAYNYPELFFQGTQTLSYPPVQGENKILSYKDGDMQWIPYENRVTTQLTGKKVVWFGDSITEFGGAKLAEISKRTGAEVVNVGFGGCKLAYDNDPAYDWFTMTKLADAIHTGDWSGQIANQVIGSDDNTAQVQRLVNMDFNAVDYLTIDYMANDFTGWVPPGTITDTTRSTISGAVNYIIDRISSKYPHIQLVFFTSMYRSRQVAGDGKDSDNFPNGRGIYQIELVDALIAAAKNKHCLVYDLYRNSGINQYNHHIYLADGLHPINPSGYVHVGSKQASFLLANT